MRTDMPAEIWLDPYRWEALQEILEQDGTDIEEVLQNYLIEVYSDRVPIERQKEVDRRIKKERLAAVQEAEARKVFCAMHIREHGQEYILMEKNANYSLADRQVCDTLDLILHREDSRDEELTYRLDDNEKAVLREKMDAYCTKETGLSLDDFCDSLMEMESTETLGLKM